MMQTYDNSVFVNCPFDSEYRPLLEAVAFSVYECGFYPRCALETDDGTQVRIEKILALIGGCRLAVHDVSRTGLDEATSLPRFNMPFELGVFVGAKRFGSREQRRKAALVLEASPYDYQKYLSDISGQDVRPHGRRHSEVIRLVRDFLSHQCDPGIVLPGSERILARYDEFRTALPETCRILHLDPQALTFRDLTYLIVEWIRITPLDASTN